MVSTLEVLLVILSVITGALAMRLYIDVLKSPSKQKPSASQALEHERIMSIINHLSDAIFSIDTEGTIKLYNAASLNLLDTNHSLTGQSISDALVTHDAEGKPVTLFDAIKSAKRVTIRDDLRIGEIDDPIRLELTFAPIKGGYSSSKQSRDGYIVIARDITKLKSLEEERDEFISVVSHELRTPIAVAEGTLSNLQVMIERGIEQKSKLRENIDEAHEQIMFLAGMINDLSTLSRAERGISGEIELIDVADLAHELYNEYAPEAAAAKLAFNLELAPKVGQVHTSRLYLHELLQNFITNAIKYTREGSVTFSITATKTTVEFAVTDTGIGISKTDQAKIFHKFYRAEDYRTRETKGTGLGLYVATKLARKIGTKIAFKSRLNHGSHFSITLPQSKNK